MKNNAPQSLKTSIRLVKKSTKISFSVASNNKKEDSVPLDSMDSMNSDIRLVSKSIHEQSQVDCLSQAERELSLSSAGGDMQNQVAVSENVKVASKDCSYKMKIVEDSSDKANLSSHLSSQGKSSSEFLRENKTSPQQKLHTQIKNIESRPPSEMLIVNLIESLETP